MTPAANGVFQQLSRPFPEPMFLVTAAGEVLEANAAGRALQQAHGGDSARFADLFDDPAERVSEALQSWWRMAEMAPAGLRLRGDRDASRWEGARLRSGAGDAILLRMVARQQAVGRFLALNERIEALAREVRRRKNVEEALSQSEEQLRTLADSIPNLAWMAREDGWIFWYNRRWYDYTGTTSEQMEGWGWQSVHDRRTLPAVLQRWRESIASGRPFEMVFPLRGADGVFREFLTRVVPVRDKQGRVVRWFGTNTDVSELQRVQDALRASQERLRVSEERLRLTQRAAHIGSWELDLDTEEYICSPEVAEIFGWERGEAVVPRERLLSTMYFSSDRTSEAKLLRQAIAKNREFETQFRIRRPDGTARWIAARGKPFYNQGRNIVLGVFIDVTETRRALEVAEPAERPVRSRTKAKAQRRAG